MIGLAPTFVNLQIILNLTLCSLLSLPVASRLIHLLEAALRVCSVSYQHNNTLAWAAHG